MAKRKKLQTVDQIGGYQTLAQAAQRWGVTRTMVNTWRRQGLIVPLAFGRARLVPVDLPRPGKTREEYDAERAAAKAERLAAVNSRPKKRRGRPRKTTQV